MKYTVGTIVNTSTAKWQVISEGPTLRCMVCDTTKAVSAKVLSPSMREKYLTCSCKEMGFINTDEDNPCELTFEEINCVLGIRDSKRVYDRAMKKLFCLIADRDLTDDFLEYLQESTLSHF